MTHKAYICGQFKKITAYENKRKEMTDVFGLSILVIYTCIYIYAYMRYIYLPYK